jgi:hypothetical protein
MAQPNGDELLLVWQSANVTWDDARQEITFIRNGGPAGETPITLRDGDTIAIGGAFVGNLPMEMHLNWLAAPSPECTGQQWFVSGVTKD